MTELINTWQRFAEITIKTNDLDPMYSVIRGLNQTRSRDWMGRFIIYFLCFYDAGGAADAAENWTDKDFWQRLKYAGQVKETKRGTERRHFRGVNALRACATLESYEVSPWYLLENMYGVVHERPPTYAEFYKRMTTRFAGTAMGPYFIWKLYDIFNICLDMPITLSFDEALKYMPDEPRKSAEHFFPSFEHGLKEVTDYIHQYKHPVRPGLCGLAEAETILCMMKGYFKTKTHVIGDDIHDKTVQLANHPELWPLLPDDVEPDAYQRGELA